MLDQHLSCPNTRGEDLRNDTCSLDLADHELRYLEAEVVQTKYMSATCVNGLIGRLTEGACRVGDTAHGDSEPIHEK